MPKATLIRGRAMRATRLNGCGNPVLGPDSVVTTTGFISVAATPNSVTGTDIQVTNANGDVCAEDRATPKFSSHTLEIALCGVDVELVNLLTGSPLVLDAEGSPVGFDDDTRAAVDLTGFALELWSGVAGDACSDSGDATYGYFVYPFAKGGTIGALTVQNNSVDFTISGATTKDGSGWGVGPYDVVRDENGVEGPLLVPLGPGVHRRFVLTTVAPPTETEGAQALGIEATGVTAGTPGSFTPAHSYGPGTLADLQASTLVGTTAWTPGQSIVLRDNSRAHWNGTAWVAGVA